MGYRTKGPGVDWPLVHHAHTRKRGGQMARTMRRAMVGVALGALVATAFAGTTTAQGGGVNEAAKSHEFDWGTFNLNQRVIDKAAAGEPLNIVVSTIGKAIPVYGVEQQIGVDRGCEANGGRGLAIECCAGGPRVHRRDHPAGRAPDAADQRPGRLPGLLVPGAGRVRGHRQPVRGRGHPGVHPEHGRAQQQALRVLRAQRAGRVGA